MLQSLYSVFIILIILWKLGLTWLIVIYLFWIPAMLLGTEEDSEPSEFSYNEWEADEYEVFMYDELFEYDMEVDIELIYPDQFLSEIFGFDLMPHHLIDLMELRARSPEQDLALSILKEGSLHEEDLFVKRLITKSGLDSHKFKFKKISDYFDLLEDFDEFIVYYESLYSAQNNHVEIYNEEDYEYSYKHGIGPLSKSDLQLAGRRLNELYPHLFTSPENNFSNLKRKCIKEISPETNVSSTDKRKGIRKSIAKKNVLGNNVYDATFLLNERIKLEHAFLDAKEIYDFNVKTDLTSRYVALYMYTVDQIRDTWISHGLYVSSEFDYYMFKKDMDLKFKKNKRNLISLNKLGLGYDIWNKKKWNKKKTFLKKSYNKHDFEQYIQYRIYLNRGLIYTLTNNAIERPISKVHLNKVLTYSVDCINVKDKADIILKEWWKWRFMRMFADSQKPKRAPWRVPKNLY